MTITMNARAALDAASLLAGWIHQILSGEVDAPPAFALRLRPTHRAFDEVAVDLLEQEDAILRRFGALEDEKGFIPRTIDGKEELGTFIIEDEEQLTKANEARTALFRADVEINTRPLSLGEVLSAGLTLTGQQALQLAPLFEDHSEETAHA